LHARAARLVQPQRPPTAASGRIGDEVYEAEAIPTQGEERERLWALLKEAYPFFADHEAKTDRTIPVDALTRA